MVCRKKNNNRQLCIVQISDTLRWHFDVRKSSRFTVISERLVCRWLDVVGITNTAELHVTYMDRKYPCRGGHSSPQLESQPLESGDERIRSSRTPSMAWEPVWRGEVGGKKKKRGIWNLFLIINHSYPLPNSQWHTTQFLVSHRVPKRRYRRLPLSRQKRNMVSHPLDYPKGTM